MEYDLIIIGGGPGGYLAAERSGHAGLKVLLIEKRKIGGVCLNEGCIPSKTFLNSAKIYEYATHGEKYGVTSTEVNFDHKKVVTRKNKVVRTLTAGIKANLKAANVTIIEEVAIIEGKDGVNYIVNVNGEKFTAPRLIIASGSTAIIPSIKGMIEGIESGFVLTNREIFDLQEIPKQLVIVGGGVIGLEMAAYFNTVGSQVTVIEMLDHIAGENDRDVSTILKNVLEKKGVTFRLLAKVTETKSTSVMFESDGKVEEIECTKVLLSIGRKPATEALGLETICVELDRASIKTDSRCRTNIPNVYAVGDVNGVFMLAHVAYREAEVAVNNILGKKDIMRYGAIPSIIYTNPEVGAVGETEATAKLKGIDYKLVNIPMMYSGRYVAENEGGTDICKVLVDTKYNKIIGCHMIGSYSSEIIFSVAMMIEQELRIDDIKEFVFPHPTVGEVIREAIFKF